MVTKIYEISLNCNTLSTTNYMIVKNDTFRKALLSEEWGLEEIIERQKEKILNHIMRSRQNYKDGLPWLQYNVFHIIKNSLTSKFPCSYDSIFLLF